MEGGIAHFCRSLHSLLFFLVFHSDITEYEIFFIYANVVGTHFVFKFSITQSLFMLTHVHITHTNKQQKRNKLSQLIPDELRFLPSQSMKKKLGKIIIAIS